MSQDLQSNLELLTPQAFAAGETKVFFLSGDYFELIDCPNPVDVVLQDASGAQRARMIGAIQTHHVKNTPFKVVQITSATAQSVRFAYGSGEAGTRQTAGAVSVSNPAAIGQANQQALQSTGNWNNTAAMVANTPLTVLAPGGNTTGVDLLDAGYFQTGGTGVRPGIFFLMKSGAAPTSFTDGEVICGPSQMGNDTGFYYGTGKLHQTVFVPPNFGIYCIAQDAMPATVAGTAAMRYARWRAR